VALQSQLRNLEDETLFVRGPNGTIRFWNKRAEEMYGWTQDEAISKTSHSLLQTQFPGSLEHIETELLQNGLWEGQLVHTRRDGTQIVVSSLWELQRDRQNEPLVVLEVNRPPRGTCQVESEMQGTKKREAFASWTWDVLTDTLAWSDELCRFYHSTPSQSGGNYSAFLQRVHVQDQAKVEASFLKALHDHQPFSIKYRLVHREDQIRLLHLYGEVVKDGNHVTMMFGIASDVTEAEVEQREQSLRHSAEELQLRVQEGTERVVLGQVGRQVEAQLRSGLSEKETLLRDLKSQLLRCRAKVRSFKPRRVEQQLPTKVTSALAPKARIAGVETMRVPADFAVVALHTSAVLSLAGWGREVGIWVSIVEQLFRFAVPFFFIAAGYFFGNSLQAGVTPGGSLLKYTRRLGLLFLAWSLIYALVPYDWLHDMVRYGVLRPIYWHLLNTLAWIGSHPLTFLFHGTAGHLWFLPALITALVTLTLFLSLRLEKYVIVGGLLFYLLGLLHASYLLSSQAYRGMAHVPSSVLSGILFVHLGWWLSRRDPPSFASALSLCLVGFVGQVTEAIVVWGLFTSSPKIPAFLVGTIPFAMGAFLLGLAKPNLGRTTPLPWVASLTLGIYLSHWIFIWALVTPRVWLTHPLWLVTLPVLIYMLSALVTLTLLRFKMTQFLVRKR
jgi:PAS domain S-box-containing protein